MTETLSVYKEERNGFNAVIAEGYLYKGKKHGFWVEYYPQTSLSALRVKARGFYEDGQKTGTWREYHWNGTLKGTGKYKKDLKVGNWCYFDSKEGFCVSVINYDGKEAVKLVGVSNKKITVSPLFKEITGEG